jgi:hypothetical protein
MSVLGFPRLYFRGEISWDPGLANNADGLFDPESVELIVPDGITIDQLKRFIATNAEDLGIWNFYGTHDTAFEQVQVVGGAALDGSAVADDPLIGRQLSLRGKLVDLDAAAANGSQVFFDRMRIGDGVVGLQARRSQRLHGRWLSFGRNLSNQLAIAGHAGVTWQTCFEKAGVSFSGTDASPLLNLLRQGLEDDAIGLMIRFHTYRTLYFQNGIRNNISPAPKTSAELQQEYAQGKNFSNPAYSVVVGSIGLWRRSEPRSVPGGRLLLAREAAPTQALLGVGGGPPELQPRQARVGPAVAELDEAARRLSVDFGATIPERSPDLTKADFGTLELVVAHGDTVTKLTTLAPEAYDRTKFEAQAGILDVDLAQAGDDVVAAIKSGTLQLRNAAGNLRLLEEVGSFVAVDERDIYLDQAEPRAVGLQVFAGGKLAPAGHQVLVAQYDRDRAFVRTVKTLAVGSDGTASFSLKAERAGIASYVFVPFPAGAPAPTAPTGLDSLNHAYLNVRTLPFDDELERNTADDDLRWSFIHDKILRLYDIINPVMARPQIGRPLDDRELMMDLASDIARVIAKGNFESASYMPITRDMSAGRRKLLERWCQLVLDGTAPEDPVELASRMAASRKQEMADIGELPDKAKILSALLANTSDFRMGRV